MYFEIPRKDLLNPLRLLVGVIEQRQLRPILGNVLVRIANNALILTGTDDEVEMVCTLPLEDGNEAGDVTLPARKWFDICRSLPDTHKLQVMISEGKATAKAGRSRFTLATLPAVDFPSSQALDNDEVCSFTISQGKLKMMLEQTVFAIANNDVRYYLTGLFVDLKPDLLSVVATDGDRMSCFREAFTAEKTAQVIVPRKAVTELLRLLGDDEADVSVVLDKKRIVFKISDSLTLSSKLIDGRYPDYQMVIPNRCNKHVVVGRDELKQALTRAEILCNKHYKTIRCSLSLNLLKISASNPNNEEAEDELSCAYEGEEFEIGFNVGYLLDVLNVIDTNEVELNFIDVESSCLIHPRNTPSILHIVMPTRL